MVYTYTTYIHTHIYIWEGKGGKERGEDGEKRTRLPITCKATQETFPI